MGLSSQFVSFDEVDDDRHSLSSNDDDIILVIEDDASFAHVLFDEVHKRNAKCLIATSGDAGLALAIQFMPDAIILDIDLLGMSGLDVFYQITSNPSLSHIPVYFISVSDDLMSLAPHEAVAYLTKPISGDQLDSALLRLKALSQTNSNIVLLIEDDISMLDVMSAMMEDRGYHVIGVDNAESGLIALQNSDVQLMILDLQLPGISGLEMLDKISEDEGLIQPPVMIYSGSDVDEKEQAQLAEYTDVFLKKNGGTPEHILRQVLQAVEYSSSQNQTENAEEAMCYGESPEIFFGKRVLLVDDDTRNVFALSKVLKNQFRMRVYIADTKEKAVEILRSEGHIDILIMDSMLSGNNVDESLRYVSSIAESHLIPIIAVSQSAEHVRVKSYAALGITDVIQKPIEATALLRSLSHCLKTGNVNGH